MGEGGYNGESGGLMGSYSPAHDGPGSLCQNWFPRQITCCGSQPSVCRLYCVSLQDANRSGGSGERYNRPLVRWRADNALCGSVNRSPLQSQVYRFDVLLTTLLMLYYSKVNTWEGTRNRDNWYIYYLLTSSLKNQKRWKPEQIVRSERADLEDLWVCGSGIDAKSKALCRYV